MLLVCIVWGVFGCFFLCVFDYVCYGCCVYFVLGCVFGLVVLNVLIVVVWLMICWIVGKCVVLIEKWFVLNICGMRYMLVSVGVLLKYSLLVCGLFVRCVLSVLKFVLI